MCNLYMLRIFLYTCPYVWRCRKDSIKSRTVTEKVYYCTSECAKIFNLLVEIKSANRLNYFSHLFLSSSSPDLSAGKGICFPYFTQCWFPLECLRGCGASLSHLQAHSKKEAVNSFIPRCLWPKKPLCHKLLERSENILRKYHCVCAIILFLRHPVLLLVEKRFKTSLLSCCVCSLVHPVFKLLQKLLVYCDVAYDKEHRGSS